MQKLVSHACASHHVAFALIGSGSEIKGASLWVPFAPQLSERLVFTTQSFMLLTVSCPGWSHIRILRRCVIVVCQVCFWTTSVLNHSSLESVLSSWAHVGRSLTYKHEKHPHKKCI